MPYTAHARKRLECPYCHEGACLPCTKKWVLLSPDVNCLACRRTWTIDTIDTLFDKGFRNGELRRHRIAQLLERERALLPETQLQLQREDVFARAVVLTNRLRDLASRLMVVDRGLDDAFHAAVAETRAALVATRVESAATRALLPGERAREGTAIAAARSFVRACPECPGFLTTAWRCPMCRTRVCPTCHVTTAVKPPVDAPSTTAAVAAALAPPSAGAAAAVEAPPAAAQHECKAEDVASAAAIARDTRGCPKCGVRIHRLSGCSQMFCTCCNTPWDWNSGAVLTGPIHNPHLVEFLARGGVMGAAAAGGCEGWEYGNPFTLAREVHVRQGAPAGSPETQALLMRMNRVLLEMLHGVPPPPYGPETHRDLRRRFLRQQLSVSGWAARLSARETSAQRKAATHALRALVAGALRDGLRTLVSTPTDVPAALRDLEAMRGFANAQFGRLARDWGSLRTAVLGEDWTWGTRLSRV